MYVYTFVMQRLRPEPEGTCFANERAMEPCLLCCFLIIPISLSFYSFLSVIASLTKLVDERNQEFFLFRGLEKNLSLFSWASRVVCIDENV